MLEFLRKIIQPEPKFNTFSKLQVAALDDITISLKFEKTDTDTPWLIVTGKSGDLEIREVIINSNIHPTRDYISNVFSKLTWNNMQIRKY